VLVAAFVGVGALVVVARLATGDNSTALSPAAVTSTTVTSTSATSTTVSLTTVTPTSATSTTVSPTTVSPTSLAPTTVAAMGEGCPADGSAAVVDRVAQRTWLCDAGKIAATFPITSAWTMPDPGTYSVYAKDLNASSNFGGHFSTMTHFVAFTYGKNTGTRVAFHSIPVLGSGDYVQPLASVGDLSRRGESSGCIRVLPDDAVRIWDALSIGDSVVVLN
jgi:hypothetical protein